MGAQATQYTVTRLCPVFHKQSRRREVCRIFLPELVPELVPGLYRRRWDLVDEVQGWEEELERVIRRTLTASCLVCWEWNKLFTPLLYRNITLSRGTSPFNVSILRRILWHVRPNYKAFISTIKVEGAKDVSTAGFWLAVSLNLPNLCNLTLDGLDPAILHPRFAQHIRLLYKRCTVVLRRNVNYGGNTKWESLQGWLRFLRSSQPTICELQMHYTLFNSE